MVRSKLSDAARERVRDAVARAEARTGAQLVVTIADSCGSYGIFAVLWATLAALAAGALAVLAAPWLDAALLVFVEGLVLVAVAAALAWKPLLMRVVPHQVRHAHARLVAEREFAARVGGRTEGGSGLLLFIALAERQVFILPDTGIAAVIAAERWDEIVHRLADTAHEGALDDAIVAAVGAAADVLEPNFPPETPTRNPLADEVVELDESTAPVRER
jgi:putative membrane protein